METEENTTSSSHSSLTPKNASPVSASSSSSSSVILDSGLSAFVELYGDGPACLCQLEYNDDDNDNDNNRQNGAQEASDITFPASNSAFKANNSSPSRTENLKTAILKTFCLKKENGDDHHPSSTVFKDEDNDIRWTLTALQRRQQQQQQIAAGVESRPIGSILLLIACLGREESRSAIAIREHLVPDTGSSQLTRNVGEDAGGIDTEKQRMHRSNSPGNNSNADNDVDDTSKTKSRRNGAPVIPDDGKPAHYSSSRSSADEWFTEWRKMEVPGVERDAFLQHLELIRTLDWAKTPLGPMDRWSTVLLSSLGQALASPFPVLLAWGPSLVQIYNFPYSININQRHPGVMGKTYAEAWPEVWESSSPSSSSSSHTLTTTTTTLPQYSPPNSTAFARSGQEADVLPLSSHYSHASHNTVIKPATEAALQGKSTYVTNAQMFLQREDYLEETYFTWSMTPVFDDDRKIVGIYIPNFDNTHAVVTERRLQLLREASQAFSVNTNPQMLFRRICRATARDPIDLPLLVFYDCSAADDERDISESSSERLLSHSHAPTDTQSISQEQPVNELPDDELAANAATKEDLQNARVITTFVRAAYTGSRDDSKIFPPEIPPPNPNVDDDSIASDPIFLKAFRHVQNTHEQVVLNREQLGPFIDNFDKTSLGDAISCVVILPITTLDDNIRAICVAGLNPRKAYGKDYQVFLDLFQAQLSHGITSIRLINEEIRRSRFFAALIKRKNEELHILLNARTEELRSSEQKFSKMAEISPSGIWTANASTGEILFVNEAWWRITGHPRDLAVSDWLVSIHDDDKQRAIEWFKRALVSRQSPEPFEFRWNTLNDRNHPRWTWAVASPEIGDNGEIISITGTLTDITEKKMVEFHQKQRAEEAIEMRRAQESFIDMTSHELRNPLSAISLSSDATTERLEGLLHTEAARVVLSQYKQEVEETLQDMKIINHCCVHMTRLIDDVLTLSKLENKFLVITPVPCRPADFISETLAIFKGEMISKDIVCDFEITPAFVENQVDYILTDPSRINQLVINILTNAIKFTAPSKTRKIKVTLNCSTTKPTGAWIAIQDSAGSVPTLDETDPDPNRVYLLVSITDTGRGLTQEEMSHLFQRFRQANSKTHISYGGSGLGLHICKRIAELLGGEIGVESIRGRGSTFTFYIPTKRCTSPLAGRMAPSPGFTTMAGPGMEDPLALAGASHRSTPASSPADELHLQLEKLSLLIVEDNLINQRLLDKHLTRVGCVTMCANHGQEAIDLIKQSKWGRSGGPSIDCVLMDIEMPVMDGLTAIQHLRQMEQAGEINGHIPVLAVTANAREEQLESMLRSGFDGTVSKPFKIPIILDRVRTLLRDLRRARAAKHLS